VQILHQADRVANVLRRAGLGRLTRKARGVVGSHLSKPMTVNVDGVKLSGGIEHRGYLYRCATGTAEPMTRALFRDAVKPGTVVLDIGAHLGLYALTAVRGVGQDGYIYAFEPDPRTFPYLVRNVAVNDASDRIATLKNAVSDHSGEEYFHIDDSTPAASRLLDQGRLGSGMSVDCVTVDSILPPNTRVSVIKIDVEGAELEALRGMTRTLAQASPSLALFLELHPGALQARHESPESVLEELEANGLTVEAVDEVRRRVRPLTALDLAGKPVHLRCTRI
jgi:FkbM family methyltransferase